MKTISEDTAMTHQSRKNTMPLTDTTIVSVTLPRAVAEQCNEVGADEERNTDSPSGLEIEGGFWDVSDMWISRPKLLHKSNRIVILWPTHQYVHKPKNVTVTKVQSIRIQVGLVNWIFSFRMKFVGLESPFFGDVRGEGGSGLFLTFWRSMGEPLGEQGFHENTFLFEIVRKHSKKMCLIVKQSNIQSIGTKKIRYCLF